MNLITDISPEADVLKILRGAIRISLDFETTSLRPTEAKITHIALATKNWQGVIPLVGENKLPYRSTIKWLSNILRGKLIYFWNAYYDVQVLECNGGEADFQIADGMLGYKMLNERMPYTGLKDLTKKLLNREVVTFDEARDIEGDNPEKFIDYAEADARNTYDLCEIIAKKIDYEGMYKIWVELEGEIVKLCSHMSQRGIYVDANHFRKIIKRNIPSIAGLEKEIQEVAGKEFDPNSSKQVMETLFDHLKIPSDKLTRTPTGRISTKGDLLEIIKEQHPVVPLLMQHRTLAKETSILTGYVEDHIHNDDRMRTNWKQMFARTFRMSSSNPNIQNFDKIWGGTRNAVISPPGYVIIQADLSQIELRLLAWKSEDKNLVDAYLTDKDIHQLTSELVGCSRFAAKAINFGIIYGMGPKKLSRTLNIPYADALKYWKNFRECYVGIESYKESVKKMMYTKKYVVGLIGRRMHIDPKIIYFYGQGHMGRHKPTIDKYGVAIPCKECTQVNAEEREAINFVIQNGCAEILKIASRNIYKALKNKGELYSKCGIVNLIHDEILVEAPIEIAKEIKDLVQYHLEHAVKLVTVSGIEIPIKADAQIVRSWADAKLKNYYDAKEFKEGIPSKLALYMKDRVPEDQIRNLYGLDPEKLNEAEFAFVGSEVNAV